MEADAIKSIAWGTTEQEKLGISNAARTAIGSEICRVSYMLAEGAELPRQGPLVYPGFDYISSVGMGVEFEMSDGSVYSVCWKTSGDTAGLSFGPGPARDRGDMASMVQYEVTDSRAWSQLVGQKILDVQCIWMKADSQGLEAVWSVRIDLGDAPPVVLALGGVDVYRRRQAASRLNNGVLVTVAIEYGVDDIVVIFDSNIAKQYRVDGAAVSAFGD